MFTPDPLHMSYPPTEKVLRRMLRGSFLVVLGAAALFYVVRTLHWPFLVNAPVMHYVVFLMQHGLKPYRDITDMNMPGAYFMESVGMLLFGGGDLGWRLYDFALLAVLLICFTAIAKPSDWLAGVYAAGLFALRHGSEGPWFAGEREQEMTVLLAASCAALFFAVRRARPVYTFGFGLFAGLTAAIKPTLLPFGLCSLILLTLELRRRAVPPRKYLLWGGLGLLLPGACSLLFLLRFGAFHAFIFVLHAVAPLYLSLNDPGRRFLLLHVAPFEWLPLVPLAIAAFLARRQWDWERGVLLLAALCGLVSYLVQQKGFWYQRYTFMAFALLLVSMVLLEPAQVTWVRWVGYGSLLYAMLYVLPRYVLAFRELPDRSELTLSMQADLKRLGGAQLQGEVQCFDVTFGCLNSLYHLGLLENTGFTGDLLLFPKAPNPVADFYRGLFWKAQATRPAAVFIVTNQDEFGAADTYARLARWPAFTALLDKDYVLAISRSFPREDRYRWQPSTPLEYAPGYRIYLRKAERLPFPARNTR